MRDSLRHWGFGSVAASGVGSTCKRTPCHEDPISGGVGSVACPAHCRRPPYRATQQVPERRPNRGFTIGSHNRSHAMILIENKYQTLRVGFRIRHLHRFWGDRVRSRLYWWRRCIPIRSIIRWLKRSVCREPHIPACSSRLLQIGFSGSPSQNRCNGCAESMLAVADCSIREPVSRYVIFSASICGAVNSGGRCGLS